MEPRSIELPGADGVKLHALEWSDEGVPLVFVHGFGNDAHVWDEVAPTVAPYYRTIAITLRGHGDSGRGETADRGSGVLVRDLEAAITSLDIERLVIVAHSLGGRVCTRYAALHPERMAGFVIVDSAPEMDRRGTTKIRQETESQMRAVDPTFASPSDYQRVLERQYPAAKSETLARLATHWTRRREDGRYELKLDLRPPSRASASGASASAVDPEKLRAAAHDERSGLWDDLRRIPCPTLVVRGAASDVLSAEVADRMVDEALPNGKLVVIPAAGHSVMLDNPEAFNRALADFALG